ncbi:MAG: hypothetical protein ACI3Y0_11060 [Prevotella sp.]
MWTIPMAVDHMKNTVSDHTIWLRLRPSRLGIIQVNLASALAAPSAAT